MDHILGEEIVRIVDDGPRFPIEAGRRLMMKGLNTLLKLSRYGIVVEDPAKPWGYAEGGRVDVKDWRTERES